MRILITGGFGFIGGRLAQHLTNLGHEITLGTRFLKSSPKWLKTAEVAKTDWHNPDALAMLCKNVDLVIHAAGMNAQDCSSDPASAYLFNGEITKTLAHAAAKEGVLRFIYLSTAHVYSSPLRGVINEEVIPENKHPYAASHLEGEKAVYNCSKIHSIEGIIARLSNVYGAPASPDAKCWSLLTNDLCKQAIQTGELRLNTNGTQKRDFLDITSACEMLSFLCEQPLNPDKSPIFNLGAGKSQSLMEMAQLIQERCRVNFGFTPKIYANEQSISENNSDLIFNIDRICHAGYLVKPNDLNEIDDLLIFCKKHFSSAA